MLGRGSRRTVGSRYGRRRLNSRFIRLALKPEADVNSRSAKFQQVDVKATVWVVVDDNEETTAELTDVHGYLRLTVVQDALHRRL
jgi:hypothetical protein